MNIPGLDSKQLAIVKNILGESHKVKIFGSRAKGNYRENSDLDICILSDIPREEVTNIREQLGESKLPFTVDLVIYNDCTEDFKKIIDSTGINLLSLSLQ